MNENLAMSQIFRRETGTLEWWEGIVPLTQYAQIQSEEMSQEYLEDLNLDYKP